MSREGDSWPAVVVIGGLGLVGVGLLALLGQGKSMASGFDQTDFRTRRRPGPVSWPLPLVALLRIGQSVLTDRNGKGRPHHGVDLYAAADTPVLSAQAGRVLRVEDGRVSKSEARRDAGLWVDVLGAGGRVFRYLHLGSSNVKPEQTVKQGQQIGTIAAAGTSGLSKDPKETHLHFEIRESDWTTGADGKGRYGKALDPLSLLPGREA